MYQQNRHSPITRTFKLVILFFSFLQIVENKSHAASHYQILWHAVAFSPATSTKAAHQKGITPFVLQMRLLEKEPVPSTIRALNDPEHFVMLFYDVHFAGLALELCYQSERRREAPAYQENRITLLLSQGFYSGVDLPGELIPSCSSISSSTGVTHPLITLSDLNTPEDIHLIILEFSKDEPGYIPATGGNDEGSVHYLGAGTDGFEIPFPKRPFFPGMPESGGFIEIMPLWANLSLLLQTWFGNSPPDENTLVALGTVDDAEVIHIVNGDLLADQSHGALFLSELFQLTVRETWRLTESLTHLHKEATDTGNSQSSGQNGGSHSQEGGSSSSGSPLSGSEHSNNDFSGEEHYTNGNGEEPPNPNPDGLVEMDVDVLISQEIVNEFVTAVATNQQSRVHEMLNMYGWELLFYPSSRSGQTAIHAALDAQHFDLALELVKRCPEQKKQELLSLKDHRENTSIADRFTLITQPDPDSPVINDVVITSPDSLISANEPETSVNSSQRLDDDLFITLLPEQHQEPFLPALDTNTPPVNDGALPLTVEQKPRSQGSTMKNSLRPRTKGVKRLNDKPSNKSPARKIASCNTRESAHVLFERRLRNQLKKGFIELREEVLPENQKASKEKVLKAAKEKIEELEEQKKEQEERLERLTEKNKKLNQELQLQLHPEHALRLSTPSPEATEDKMK